MYHYEILLTRLCSTWHVASQKPDKELVCFSCCCPHSFLHHCFLYYVLSFGSLVSLSRLNIIWCVKATLSPHLKKAIFHLNWNKTYSIVVYVNPQPARTVPKIHAHPMSATALVAFKNLRIVSSSYNWKYCYFIFTLFVQHAVSLFRFK